MKRRSAIGKRLAALAITGALLLGLGLPVFAAEAPARRVVRVACGINRSLYLDENGDPQGCCAEYLGALANAERWDLEYVEGGMNESVQNLAEGRVDLLLPIQRLAAREETMEFSTLSGGYQPVALFTKAGEDVLYNDFAALDGARIAVTEGSSNELVLQEYAQAHGFSYRPVYIESMEGKAQAVENGTADYIAASTVADAEGSVIVAVMSYEPFYYAVKKGSSALLAELNEGMAHLMAAQPELAAGVYLNFLNSGIRVANTEEENAWLKKEGKVVVAVYRDTPPLYHEDADGSAHGIYVDLLKMLEEKTGAEIQLYPVDRDTYAYDLLEESTIDVVLGSSDAPLRALHNKYRYSSPLMDYTTVTISRHDYGQKDHPVYILTSARKYWESMILRDYPNATIRYCKTAKDCLIAVQEGKADLTMMNAWEFNYQSKNARFSDLIEWENNRIYADIVMVTLADADETVVSVINKGIAQLNTTAVNELVTVNLNSQYDSYTLADSLYAYRYALIGSAVVMMLMLGFFISYTLLRRRYTRQLESNYHQLERTNAAKSDFLARMSHDIRTPLNVIIGMCRLAEENKNPPDTGDCLQKIHISGSFLLGLVNDVLDMERIDSGKVKLYLEPYSSQEFARYIDAVIRPLCEQKGIRFEYGYEGGGDFVILQDKLRTNQIYFNLLSNAVKFTPAGGLVRMHTDVSRRADTVILDVTVADTGCGMSEEFQKRMFQPFEQESQKATPADTGTGLGLSIVQRLCGMMGIRLSVESTPGKGTTFTLHGEFADVAAAVPAVPAPALPETELAGRRILVCEDHPLNREIARRLLEEKGMTVLLAEDGRQGVEAFAATAPGGLDAVLMDIRMPVMDGLEAAKAIRALPRPDAKTVPIIALSANAYEEDVKKCLAAGMNAHLAKPFEPEALYRTLRQQIEPGQNRAAPG